MPNLFGCCGGAVIFVVAVEELDFYTVGLFDSSQSGKWLLIDGKGKISKTARLSVVLQQFQN